MRTYRTNSPEAAARLLAMALVADGNYSLTEIRALDRIQASHRLGLSPEAIKEVLDLFCEDLLSAAHGEWTGSARMDDATRQQLLDEVQDPALRALVVDLCQSIVQADGHEAEGEAALLDALTRAWRAAPAAAGARA
ncbi:TerB family tellurite resistance protein [Hydrogenophaga sp.]